MTTMTEVQRRPADLAEDAALRKMVNALVATWAKAGDQDETLFDPNIAVTAAIEFTALVLVHAGEPRVGYDAAARAICEELARRIAVYQAQTTSKH